MSVRPVRASQFLRQFYLIVWYKPKKKHIILDTLSKQASANNLGYDISYFEFNALVYIIHL